MTADDAYEAHRDARRTHVTQLDDNRSLAEMAIEAIRRREQSVKRGRLFARYDRICEAMATREETGRNVDHLDSAALRTRSLARRS